MANCLTKCPKSPCVRGLLLVGLIASAFYFFRKKKCCA
jgi:hypothetical protein